MPEIEPETSETLHDIKYTPKHQEHVHSLHNSENTFMLSSHASDLLTNANND